MGTGFATANDSLHALRAKYDLDLSPVVTEALEADETGSRFLDRAVRAIRRHVDEPSVDPKYETRDLVEMIETAFGVALADLNAQTDAPLKVRTLLSIGGGTQEYLLPPSIQQITAIVRYDAATHLPAAQWMPRAETNWRGAGFRLEGRTLRLDPPCDGDAFEVQLEYIPNGDSRLHYGVGSADAARPTEFVLAENPLVGTLDTRENAYAGSVLRINVDGTGFVQERTITAYDRATRTCTLNLAFSPAPGGATSYEIVPVYGKLIEAQVALAVAEDILASADKPRKYQLIERQHAKVKRANLLALAKMENILGDHFEGRTARGV
jgi:hypothetical protein